MAETVAYANPDHAGNSAKFHTGKNCITKGCEQPAGTWWSPHWCFACNVERITRISSSLDDIVQRAAFDAAVRKAADEWHGLIEYQRKTINAMVLASGGTLTIKMADRERKIISEGCSYNHEAGTETWRVEASI